MSYTEACDRCKGKWMGANVILSDIYDHASFDGHKDFRFSFYEDRRGVNVECTHWFSCGKEWTITPEDIAADDRTDLLSFVGRSAIHFCLNNAVPQTRMMCWATLLEGELGEDDESVPCGHEIRVGDALAVGRGGVTLEQVGLGNGNLVPVAFAHRQVVEKASHGPQYHMAFLGDVLDSVEQGREGASDLGSARHKHPPAQKDSSSGAVFRRIAPVWGKIRSLFRRG